MQLPPFCENNDQIPFVCHACQTDCAMCPYAADEEILSQVDQLLAQKKLREHEIRRALHELLHIAAELKALETHGEVSDTP